MSSLRIAFGLQSVVVAGLLLTLASCSGDDDKPKASGNIFGTGGTGGTSDTGGTGGVGGDAGDGGASGSAGSAGTAGGATGGVSGEGGAAGQSTGGKAGAAGQGPDLCNNGQLDPGEPCDGTELNGATCITQGFDSGSLACLNCEFDITGCTGTERCYDGIDNDADTDTDCNDSDCAAYCANPCNETPAVDDPGSVEANSMGHSTTITSSCATSSGPELVFAFEPTSTGVAEISLTSMSDDLTLSARTTCSGAASELACADDAVGTGAVERLVVPVEQGQPIYIVVDGSDADQAGEFELAAYSRPIVCGDGNHDPGEECDDGGLQPNDGCSPNCELESDESEPNDTVGQATPYVSGFVGSIGSASDVDYISVVATEPLSNIVVDTFDLGDGACTDNQMDTYVRIFDTDGTTVLAQDDDSGAGYCAHAAVGNLDPGTYYVQITRAGVGPASFPYFLAAVVDWCGSGVQSETEDCDDGNTTSGDTCPANCTF